MPESLEPEARRLDPFRLLQAQYAAARVVAEGEVVDRAAFRLLQEVATTIGWRAGALWVVDEGEGIIHLMDVWVEPGLEGERFARESRERVFRPGEGLPGRVWERGEPAWIPDIAEDDNFPRGKAALASGLRAGFAFPFRVGAQVLGVMELFTDRPTEPDDLLLEAMDAVGSQFGQLIARTSSTKVAESAILEGERRLRQALEAGGMGTWDWEIGSGTVTWSSTLEELHGLEPGTFGGTFDAFVTDIHPEDRDEVIGATRAAVDHDEPYEIEYRILRPDGAQRWLEARGEVRRDDQGRAVRMVGVCADVTERRELEEVRSRLLEGEQAARAEAEEARHRLEFLAEAGRILGSSLNFEKTLSKVATLSVPRIGDWCSVDIPEGGSVRQVALAHQDPEKAALARRLRERYPPSLDAAGGLAQVLRTGEPVMYREIPPRFLETAARDEEHLRILRELGLRSAMVVPLVARGRILGAISFVTGESGRTFHEGDLRLARELADRAAVAIDNARLYEERSYIARTLQRSLLPPVLPEIPGMQIAARYHPLGEGNQVGGDFYDVFERAPGEWMVVVGDVQGKGPDAAALTGLARHTLRAAAMREIHPSQALLMLNEAILSEETGRFATAALGRLLPDRRGASLTVSCGGHPLPHVVRADGSIERVGKHGTLLGMFEEEMELHDETIHLGPGDAVIFYTDGVIEDRRSRTEGEARRVRDLLAPCAAASSAEEMAACLDRIVERVQAGGPQDDVAVLVVRVAPEG